MLLESLLTYYLIMTAPVLNDRTVDLRKAFPPVFDQGYSNSCTANAITSVASFHERKADKNSKLISRSDLYHQSTLHKYKDKGASLKRSMDVLSNEGLCDETFWPYRSTNSRSDPPSICVNNRKRHSTLKPFHIPSNAECIAYAVRTNHPVVIGTVLTESFYRKDRSNQKRYDPIVSKHAMVVVGVTNHDDYFIIRNSWGNTWNDKGHITVPRRFIDKSVLQAWTLTPLNE